MADKPPERRPSRKKDEAKEKAAGGRFSHAVPAKVEEIIGRTGTRGEAV